MMDNAEYFLDLDIDGNYAVAALLGEGKREGKREGKELGIKVGEKRGRKEGRMEERMQIAKRMLAAGMSFGDVVKYTKLTTKEQKELVV